MDIPHVDKYKQSVSLEKDESKKLDNRNFEISRARERARPLEEAEEEEVKEAALMNSFIYGHTSLKEFHSKYSAIRKPGELKQGEVMLSNFEEMEDVLYDFMGQTNETAKELTEHEKEHYDRVKELGWSARLLFRFFISKDGIVSGRAGIDLSIPEKGDDEDIRLKLKTIIEAPEDLSDTDAIATKEKNY